MGQVAKELLLIVRHGTVLGATHDSFLDVILDHIESTDPTFRRCIVCHAIGAGEPSLAGVATVMFWLADPLNQRFPACFKEARKIADRAIQAGIRLVNPPQALSNTVKSIQARLWADGAITTPSHRVFATREEFLVHLDRLDYPVVVKSDQRHMQKGMRLCRKAADARRASASDKLKAPISVAPFIDTREGYRTTLPGSLWARFYHKKRAIVLGDIVHPRHVLFSRKPIVGLASSILAPYGPRRPKGKAGKSYWRWARALLRPRPHFLRDRVGQQSVVEDNQFFRSPPEAPELLQHACRLLGLEKAAIDYSVKANGEIVLWEANPFFEVIPREHYILPEERLFSERRCRLLEDSQRFFASLISTLG